MKLYYVGIADDIFGPYILEKRPRPIRFLTAFNNISPKVQGYMEHFDDIFIDSGAYSAWTKGKTVDIREYGDFILSNLNTYTVFASLDDIEDSKQSMENWKTLLEMGVPPAKLMPVVHNGEDLRLIGEYLKYTNYIGLGGVAQEAFQGQSALEDWFQFIFSRFPRVRFHAFGINTIPLLMKFPFYSADALTWRSGSRFGELVTPWGRFRIGKGTQQSPLSQHRYRTDVMEWLWNKYKVDLDAEGFKYYEIDKVNIQVLYDLLEVEHKGLDQTKNKLTQGYLF